MGSCAIKTNCKIKYKFESQNPLGNNRVNVTLKQLGQCHLGTIVLVSLGKNLNSVTWELTYQSHLGTIVPVSLGNICSSLIMEKSCQSHLRNILIGNNFTSVTLDQLRGCHLGKTVPASLGLTLSVSPGNYRGSILRVQLPVLLQNNLVSSIWKQI